MLNSWVRGLNPEPARVWLLPSWSSQSSRVIPHTNTAQPGGDQERGGGGGRGPEARPCHLGGGQSYGKVLGRTRIAWFLESATSLWLVRSHPLRLYSRKLN